MDPVLTVVVLAPRVVAPVPKDAAPVLKVVGSAPRGVVLAPVLKGVVLDLRGVGPVPTGASLPRGAADAEVRVAVPRTRPVPNAPGGPSNRVALFMPPGSRASTTREPGGLRPSRWSLQLFPLHSSPASS